MPRVGLAFVRCATCTHGAVAGGEGAPCRLCGGAVEAAPEPPDLFAGWRCGCFQCTWTPC